jgi:recombinational DNA repair protein RecT
VELVKQDKLTGEIEIDMESPDRRHEDRLFCLYKTLNGFRKTLYMTTEEVTAHARNTARVFFKL